MNVGKVLRFPSKKHAEVLLSLGGYKSNSTIGAFDDWYFCIAAHILGYDAVIFGADDTYYVKHLSGIKRNQVELTVCGDLNNTNTLCPSFELRRADNRTCICNETQPYLTCK